jgi:hypothetical protein
MEEFAETGSPLDEKEEESDDQEEEEWSSYPCLPPNESNSLTHTLFDCPPCLPKEDECYIDECDDPIDSFEISLFDEIAACDTCAHDTTMNETCEMTLLLLFMIIHATLIDPMIILYLFQLLICMMMRKFAYKIYMIML